MYSKAEFLSDLSYQDKILLGVSRTFALTIPQLPKRLYTVVANAYLLCRIADTIEDDGKLAFSEKQRYYKEFIDVIDKKKDAQEFAHTVFSRLSDQMTDAERDLMKNTERVIHITHGLTPKQQSFLKRCLIIMSHGMEKYQEGTCTEGLKDILELDSYCYYVAGVVGEMLTELFCDYSEEINKNREILLKLGISFGQGLQMTNILKDIWDDKKRGYCWLPQTLFNRDSFELKSLSPHHRNKAFEQGLKYLIALTHGHLTNALSYTLLIPRSETGIRKFCLYALGMAVLTLNKLYRHPDFTESREVKISRRSVKATIITTSLAVSHDRLLTLLFRAASKRLPSTPVNPENVKSYGSEVSSENFYHSFEEPLKAIS
jgi:farnesyl-diphosphate farnesyltransferase